LHQYVDFRDAAFLRGLVSYSPCAADWTTTARDTQLA